MENIDNEKSYYTFGMIKPDGMVNLKGILKKIYDSGLKVVYYKYTTLTDDLIDENYAHVKDKDFYPQMKDNLLSGPSLLMIIYDKNGDAVKSYREILGSTKSYEAKAGTIRAEYGNKKIDCKNAAHGSGNKKEAKEETIRFLKNDIFEIFEAIEKEKLKDFDNSTFIDIYNQNINPKNYVDDEVNIIINYCYKKMRK